MDSDFKKKRNKVEKYVYSVLNIYDKSGMNTDKYKKFFSSLSDKEFLEWTKKPYCVNLYLSLYKTNIMMEDILDALKYINVPFVEKIYDTSITKNKERIVNSKNAAVMYIHIKRESQMTSKKNSMSVDISNRDMNTGLLMSDDKNGMMTDRENESLIVNRLNDTYKEFAFPRGDHMNSKNDMYNIISTTGSVSLSDLNMKKSESLATGIIDAYLISAGLKSNIKNSDYILSKTIEKESK